MVFLNQTVGHWRKIVSFSNKSFHISNFTADLSPLSALTLTNDPMKAGRAYWWVKWGITHYVRIGSPCLLYNSDIGKVYVCYTFKFQYTVGFWMMEKQICPKLNLWSYDSAANKKFVRNRCCDRNMIFNVNRVNTSLFCIGRGVGLTISRQTSKGSS